MLLFLLTPFVVPVYVLLDIYAIIRHYRPLRPALARLDAGDIPTLEEVSPAVVRALNLPFLSFIRVTFMHGPLTTFTLLTGMLIANGFLDANWATWQITGFALTVLFFSSPTHAIFEYFAISRVLAPTYLQLWSHCPRLRPEDRAELVSINLKQKLLYLAIFLTALPLLFFAISIFFKVELLLVELGVGATFQQLTPLLLWIGGVVGVCMLGAVIMSVLTASEVSSSAARMIDAMREVEKGELDNRLVITTTDEYQDLYRGFNLMTESLREEVQILEVAHDLAGELNLDKLIERIMTAATDLLSAERSTLFVFDPKTDELWSRYAEGLEVSEIRIASGEGIAGAVFTSRKHLSIPDPYSHPLFNADVDRETGFTTRSILTPTGDTDERFDVPSLSVIRPVETIIAGNAATVVYFKFEIVSCSKVLKLNHQLAVLNDGPRNPGIDCTVGIAIISHIAYPFTVKSFDGARRNFNSR